MSTANTMIGTGAGTGSGAAQTNSRAETVTMPMVPPPRPTTQTGANLFRNGTFADPVIPQTVVSINQGPVAWNIPANSNVYGRDMLHINVCRSGNEVWGSVTTKHNQYVALNSYNPLGQNLDQTGIALGPYIEQVVSGLTPGSWYAITVTASLRPGYASGKLCVYWDATEVLPKTTVTLTRTEYTATVNATQTSHRVRISFSTNLGEPGTGFIEEAMMRLLV